jgi:uncharacterized metal-binding protein
MTTSCSKKPGAGRVCGDARNYVDTQLQAPPKTAVLACEGACVKGEVARVAANMLAYSLERERSVRICLGDAATAESGMRTLVERAPAVIAVEGCPLHCGTEILKPRLPETTFTIVTASALYSYDRHKYFEIFDMPRAELEAHAAVVAERIRRDHFPDAPARPASESGKA